MIPIRDSDKLPRPLIDVTIFLSSLQRTKKFLSFVLLTFEQLNLPAS